MKRANRFLLLFGVILAAASFVVVLAFGSFNQPPAAPAEPDVPVVVAATNLTLGTPVTAEMLTTVTRKQSQAVNTFQDPVQIVGQVVRRAVTQGQDLSAEDFQTGVSVPELVSSLQPGLRAIALPLSKVDAVAALLQPGDYVDVILSLEDVDLLNPIVVPNPNALPTSGDSSEPYISLDQYVNNTSVKVIVQNVQVLAALPRDVAQTENSTVVEPDVVVVLAVQTQQVEAIRFAQLDGRVSLVLRAPADVAAGAVDTTGITLRELVDNWGVLPPLPVTP